MRPIPVNEAGLRHGQQFHAQAYVPVWAIPQRAAAPARADLRQVPGPLPRAGLRETWAPSAVLLLGVSGLTGVLAVISSLELWPFLAASNVGLDERGAFFLLVSGVYLLATTLYAAWRTRLLQDIRRAPWDARLMAYANLGVGGAVSVALGVMAMAVVVVIVLLAGIAALALSGGGDQRRG